jgi:AGCS family alanine or glycine:cation symporter
MYCTTFCPIWPPKTLICVKFAGQSASMRRKVQGARRSASPPCSTRRIAILLLSGTIAELTKDYFAKRRQGLDPVFHAAGLPELRGQIDGETRSREEAIGTSRSVEDTAWTAPTSR